MQLIGGGAVPLPPGAFSGNARRLTVVKRSIASSRTRVRKSVFTLGRPGDDLDWYAKAVEELKRRPLTDPTSWRYLAAVHGYPGAANDPFGTPGEKAPSKTEQRRFWNQCQHQSWFFLPWHRGYLACFEEIVAATVVKLGGEPGWALPYWNYSDPKVSQARSLPAACLDPRDESGSVNPLWLPGRKMQSASAMIPSWHTGLDALRYAPFSVATAGGHPGFGGPETGFSHFGGLNGLLEDRPHNFIHDDIGGLMGDPDTAALDPIFWLHHANIDRLWEVWTHRDRTFTDPETRAWLTESFALHDAKGKVVTFAPAQMLDTTKVRQGYRYDDISDPFVKAPALVSAPARAGLMAPSPQLVAASQPGIAITGPRTTVRVPFNQPARQSAVARFGATRPVRAYLNLENITGTGIYGSYEVYIDAPPAAGKPDAPPLLAGHLSTFGVRKASRADSPHGGAGITSVLDITSVIDELHRDRAWDGSHLDVSFVPSSPPAASAQSQPLTIGRISVYYS
jgi:tyrosinase